MVKRESTVKAAAQAHKVISAALFSADAARELLESIRWPNGPVCPHCSGTEAYKITPKNPGKRSARPGLYKCRACRKQFTVTVGTIFEDSKVPLNKWMMALQLMTASKKGVSAHQLHRMLGVQYKTAWFMNHRIRKAMEREPLASLLTGTVEADETYVGGKGTGSQGGPTAGGSKAIVFTLVSRDGDARSEMISDTTSDTLHAIINEEVDRKAALMTDTYQSYVGLESGFASHESVNHSAGEYVRGNVHINTAESFFSLFKRGLVGSFHHVSRKHMFRYLAEFDFRWNRRKTEDAERLWDAVKAAEGKRLFYKATKGAATA